MESYLIQQIIMVILAIIAIPLGVFLMRKKVFNRWMMIACATYFFILCIFNYYPVFAINSSNFLVRFVNEVLIANLAFASLGMILLAIIVTIYKKIKR